MQSHCSGSACPLLSFRFDDNTSIEGDVMHDFECCNGDYVLSSLDNLMNTWIHYIASSPPRITASVGECGRIGAASEIDGGRGAFSIT